MIVSYLTCAIIFRVKIKVNIFRIEKNFNCFKLNLFLIMQLSIYAYYCRSIIFRIIRKHLNTFCNSSKKYKTVMANHNRDSNLNRMIHKYTF